MTIIVNILAALGCLTLAATAWFFCVCIAATLRKPEPKPVLRVGIIRCHDNRFAIQIDGVRLENYWDAEADIAIRHIGILLASRVIEIEEARYLEREIRSVVFGVEEAA